MRIHFVHITRRKPHHDGSVMTNPDKKRLVEIPPRSGEPPDGGIDIDSVSTLNATTSSKECNIRMFTSVLLNFLLPQSGVMWETS